MTKRLYPTPTAAMRHLPQIRQKNQNNYSKNLCVFGGGWEGYNPPMRSAVIVYNPTAGRFSAKPFIKSVVNELESAGWQAEVAETQSGEHTIELARQAAAEKKDAAFAVGGDGTIGNVV